MNKILTTVHKIISTVDKIDDFKSKIVMQKVTTLFRDISVKNQWSSTELREDDKNSANYFKAISIIFR